MIKFIITIKQAQPHVYVLSSKTHSFKFKPLCAAVSFALLSTTGGVAVAQQDGADVEEVIVTGTYIRRSEGLIAASPITQLTAEDIVDQGTLNMNQIVQNMTFNNGTGVTGGIQASGGSSNTGAFNLRGLGTRATLQLIDGKRTTNGNIQTLLPNIAIQRMDIVTDGAAALYGTDAVAGVVNMLPYKSYDGFKIEHFNEEDSRGDFRDQTTSFLWGTSLGADVELVVAGAWRHNGTLKWTDRPSLALAGLTDNSGGNPTSWNIPNRDENGVLLADGSTTRTPEPSCGTDPVTDPMVEGGNKFGTLALGRCWFPFADTRDFLQRKSQINFFSNINWDVNNDLTLGAQLLWGRQQTHGRANQGNPGARASELPDIRGELPGNPVTDVSPFERPTATTPKPDATARGIESNSARKRQAVELLTQAKQDARAGRFASARDKVAQAEKLDVVYDLFDERPSLIAREINRLASNAALAERKAMPFPAAQ